MEKWWENREEGKVGAVSLTVVKGPRTAGIEPPFPHLNTRWSQGSKDHLIWA